MVLHSDLSHQENIVNFDGQMSSAQRHCPSPGLTVRKDDLPGQAPPRTRNLGNYGRNQADTSLTPEGPSTTSDGGSNYHAIQAKSVIQIDLHNPCDISREQQSLLKSALQLVNSIADSESNNSVTALEEETSLQDSASICPESPSRELLFMLLHGPQESISIQWPDHISYKTFTKMAVALLRSRSEIGDHRFHQHSVCIYVKAVFHLYQASRTNDDPLIKDELSRSRSAYTMAAMRSIEHFNILKPPDLSSIQSLISIALLMQHLGRPHQCWLFISYAARQITALNYHKIRGISNSSDSEQEIHNVVYWCFYLDRTLSYLLCRPPSLPDLEVSPTDLIVLEPSSPYDVLLRVLLDLAQVQGRLHSVSCGGSNQSKSQSLETCQILELRMQSLLTTLELSRDSYPKIVQYDWVAVDFCYYAILVEIHRTHLQSAFSPGLHRQCLTYARKSLRAFHFLQQHSADMPGFEDPYPSFLTWTLFFYPLSAFFVVFCNIIGTIDHDDFKLMGQITQRLSPFKQDPHLGKLLNLLQSLEQLCEPLFQVSNGASEANSISQTYMPAAPLRLSDNPPDPVTTGAFDPAMPFGDNMESNIDTGWQEWRPPDYGTHYPFESEFRPARMSEPVDNWNPLDITSLHCRKTGLRTTVRLAVTANSAFLPSPSLPIMHSHHDAGFTVQCAELKWLPLAPGVFIKIVKLVPETGEYSIMVRAQPGGLLPPHRHVDSAEIYVLKGNGAHPQTGEFTEGDYVSESKGAIHDALPFECDTELLMVSRGLSVFLAEDGSDMYTMDVAMLQGMLQGAGLA
ncbi:hypothetical protein N7541_010831 [Penicillium brevicompactum]|uniref:Xylanolytic transcriptional activator regulatory domain-containing protein n=1 Tax=Penicillium brevicompactum TaxID=5074 RepID=A0A9W9UI01_PENBR|nr:hypothetical protein N7541_010831 [Penicillium brevicompactum]